MCVLSVEKIWKHNKTVPYISQFQFALTWEALKQPIVSSLGNSEWEKFT